MRFHANDVFSLVEEDMRKALVVLATVFLAVPALAQRRPPPALMVKVEDKSEPLKLSEVDVEVQILGHMAETRMTMTFFNPNSRRLAGDLYFPLPEGSTVSGYALDVHGKMVDGVVVEKQKARQVFEKEVRKGIDPGLVEWTGGNNFKTRVFPIPANGSRTIMVRYLSELVVDSEGPNYFLPLNFRDKVGKFHVRVEVVKPSAPPKVKRGPLANFSFAAWRDSFVAETEMADARLTEDLVVALPDVSRKNLVVEESGDGEFYFAIHDFPPENAEGRDKADPPSRVAVLWDASGSRGKTDHKRELEILSDFFARFPDEKIVVDLVVFRNAADNPVRFKVRDGKAGELLEALENVAYDGGTQMASISPPRVMKRPDLYLLFSDGISNFGKEEPEGLDAPVYAISGDATANHPFLRYLCMKTGGAYFNLNRLENSAVVPELGRSPFSFISAGVLEGKIAGIYPNVSVPVHGHLALAGRLRSSSAKIAIRYGVNGKVTHTEEYTVERSGAVKRNMLRIFWAQKKVDDLTALVEKNRDELVEMGRQFGLVTPGTSLMVLETLEQYVEHKIAPPESLPDMRRAYFDRLEGMERDRKVEVESKVQHVLALWKSRVEWWEKKFDYPPDFRVAGEADKKAEARPEEEGEDREMSREEARSLSAVRSPGAMGSAGEAEASVEERPRPAKKCKGKRDGADEPPPPEPEITIKEWDPDTPYLKELKKAGAKEHFAVYMKQRKEHGASPAFFLDCAEFFYRQEDDRLAIQVLSNIVELELENAALLRVVAHRLAQWKLLDVSRMMFEEVLKLRPEEPQSYRDLALVLDQMEKYDRAIELLYHVVMNRWDRFDQIEVIALMELNRIIARAKRADGAAEFPVDKRLIKLLDVDVRIILTWDTDLTDMDLWVTEPSREKAYYSNNRTTIGGLVSRDFTQGYGPEEYVLKRSMKGEYKIEANYYGSSAPALTGGVTLQVDVFTNYGRKNEKRQSLTIRLTESKDVVHVGTVKF